MQQNCRKAGLGRNIFDGTSRSPEAAWNKNLCKAPSSVCRQVQRLIYFSSLPRMVINFCLFNVKQLLLLFSNGVMADIRVCSVCGPDQQYDSSWYVALVLLTLKVGAMAALGLTDSGFQGWKDGQANPIQLTNSPAAGNRNKLPLVLKS